MRLLLLYVRSRSTSSAVLAIAASCLLASWSGRVLAQASSLDPRTAALPVVVASALAVAVSLASTLHSDAGELEATTPRPWARWRLAHACVCAVLAAVVLLPVLPPGAYGQHSLIRNSAGLWGLALISAVCLGPRLAWAVPLGYSSVTYLAAGTATGGGRHVWAFVMQPSSSRPAAVTALALLAVGASSWSLAASRRHPGAAP